MCVCDADGRVVVVGHYIEFQYYIPRARARSLPPVFPLRGTIAACRYIYIHILVVRHYIIYILNYLFIWVVSKKRKSEMLIRDRFLLLLLLLMVVSLKISLAINYIAEHMKDFTFSHFFFLLSSSSFWRFCVIYECTIGLMDPNLFRIFHLWGFYFVRVSASIGRKRERKEWTKRK